MLGTRGRKALLVLEDGSTYRGAAFAGEGEVLGEVVFNTGMSRLPGDPHRPLLQGADRRDDLPADRQHRDQPGGHGVGGDPSRGVRRSGVRGVPEQLALPRNPQGVSGAARQARRRGDRHAGADPADPDHRRHAGDPLHRDGGQGAPARARPGLPRARRPGPGERGDQLRGRTSGRTESPGRCRLRGRRLRQGGASSFWTAASSTIS